MEEYAQAKTLLTEAVRLHPRHPVVLATMAEVLYELERYKEAKEYIDRSLSIRISSANEKLKHKIELKMQIMEANAGQQQQENDNNEF
jgi:Tfp pilus assembly protein PilF